MHNEKYLKAKIKSYDDKVNTNFYENKVSKGGVFSVCLSKLLRWIDTIAHKYFLKLCCRSAVKEKKMSNVIDEAIEISSDDSDEDLYGEELSEKE